MLKIHGTLQTEAWTELCPVHAILCTREVTGQAVYAPLVSPLGEGRQNSTAAVSVEILLLVLGREHDVGGIGGSAATILRKTQAFFRLQKARTLLHRT